VWSNREELQYLKGLGFWTSKGSLEKRETLLRQYIERLSKSNGSPEVNHRFLRGLAEKELAALENGKVDRTELHKELVEYTKGFEE